MRNGLEAEGSVPGSSAPAAIGSPESVPLGRSHKPERTYPLPLTGMFGSMRLSRPLVSQRDLVRWGDGVGLNGSESLAKALASLAQELERVGGRTPRGSALRVGPVLLDKMRLKGRSDFIGRLKRMVDGLVPGSVVNHAANVNTLCGVRLAMT